MANFYFPRTELAAAIYQKIQPDPILGDQSGLFLASPRRTGKSTFLRRDLVPLLEEKGIKAIYVDLWSDRTADPGRLIADAIAKTLEAMLSPLAKATRRFNAKSVSVGGVTVELSNATGTRTATLAEALTAIGEYAGKNVALIVDEAQQALTTSAGLDALFALKAARDAMNLRPDGARLFLVFTGSHRDKLAGFVYGHKDPFYGAAVSDFPKLGKAYVEALVDALNARLAENNQLKLADVETAFELVGHQPEILTRLLSDHALGSGGSKSLHKTVTQRAADLRGIRWDQLSSDYGELSELQQAVLMVLAMEGADFAPFSGDTIARISTAAGRRVQTTDVQKALNALRDNSLVWRPTRGVYALEDQDMRDWLLADQDG